MCVGLYIVSEAGSRWIRVSEALFILESLESVVLLYLMGHIFVVDNV